MNGKEVDRFSYIHKLNQKCFRRGSKSTSIIIDLVFYPKKIHYHQHKVFYPQKKVSFFKINFFFHFNLW